jgi:hypothetical protein
VKRAGALYDAIAEPENLRRAWLAARRGKRQRAEVRRFAARLDIELERLRRGLLGEIPLELGRYRYFMVYDPKPRMICAAAFPERVLHHAVMNICEPVLEGYAIYDSYACRRGKGGLKAVERAQHFCRGFTWYLKIDMRKYFDSIDHRILLDLLARRFREKRLLRLFAELLQTYETAPGRGLPIGNLVSQHLANFYLGRFDHWLKEVERRRGYLRYMDDCLLFARERRELKELLPRLREFLAAELDLRIKDDYQLNRTANGIPFLGYRVFAGRLRLRPASLRRLRRKFRLYERLYRAGVWDERQLQEHAGALLAFARRAEIGGVMPGLLAAGLSPGF